MPSPTAAAAAGAEAAAAALQSAAFVLPAADGRGSAVLPSGRAQLGLWAGQAAAWHSREQNTCR